jgi:hypothetical protein
MARVRFKVEDHHISTLQRLVEVSYGSTVINSADCFNISNLIAKSKYGNISAQTLRRFFGLIDAPFNASLNTLNVLSQYCGYEDFAHFHQKSIHDDTFLQDIVGVCTAFFKIEILPVKKYQLNEPYFNAVQNIAKLIYSDLNLYNRVVPKLADNPTAHEYFFERFPFIDKLCCGLGNGYKFYLRYKKNPEAIIFGNSLLFLGLFLEEKFDLAFNYLSVMNKVNNWATLQLHPFVLARLIGSNLVYAHATNDLEKKEIWLFELHKTLNSDPNKFGHNINSCEFEFMICEYLLLAKCYDQIKVIIAKVIKGFKHEPLENKANFYYIPSHVIYYKSLIMTGEFKLAVKIPFINENVNWQITDYYSLHLIQCELKTTRSKVTTKNKLKQYYHLLNQTKFTYFNSLLE